MKTPLYITGVVIKKYTNTQEKSFHFYLILIGDSNNYLSPDQAQKITSIINDVFFTKNAVKLIGYGDPEEFNEVVASHQTMLARLENALVKVAEDYANNRRADENQLQQHKCLSGKKANHLSGLAKMA